MPHLNKPADARGALRCRIWPAVLVALPWPPKFDFHLQVAPHLQAAVLFCSDSPGNKATATHIPLIGLGLGIIGQYTFLLKAHEHQARMYPPQISNYRPPQSHAKSQ